MGRRGGRNFAGGRGRGRGGGGGSRGYKGGSRYGPRPDYPEVEKRNAAFERYYNELAVVGEDEREEFWTALRRELPNSFRFAGSKGHALAVQQRLMDHYIPEITSVQYEGKSVTPPEPISWFPERLAWQMTTPKNVVRKFPPFASFQKFLVSETSVGNISRQEVVSMIPPLLMDIRPGMTVLDLCAAPGSKSAQLIEMVHGGEEARVRNILHKIAQEQEREMSPDGIAVEAEKLQADRESDWSDDGRATGLLIANDVDYRRAQMLVHQVKRLNSPNLIVTNHDATLFPSIQVPSEPGQGARYLKFDRILADVPCSGDGTCRKNPNVWKDWIPGNGLGLHATQARILVRALQMLKVGGRVVYSTCSMNPIENEAVVASAIDRCGGSEKVRLVDCTDALPGLKRRPGLSQWNVMDKTGRLWSSWNDVEAAKDAGGEEGFGRLAEGMFPPNDPLPLERCMRVYPHLQDTGGFFIAVLEKLVEIKARPESKAEPKKTGSTPTVMDLVKEIREQPLEVEGTGRGHLKTLEEMSPWRVDPANSMDTGNAPAAARQNRENTPESLKRPVDDSDDADGSSKRAKFVDNRVEHWPPPPVLVSDMPDASDTTSAPQSASESTPKKKSNQSHEEPFKYLAPDHEELLRIYSFYEISPRFPRDRFMVRNATGAPVKAIYYTSVLAREILTLNEGKGMKFVHCGVKMFMKQDAQGQDICRWRIQSEGLPIIEPWVGEGRIVRLWKRETLRKLLREMFPRVANNGWKELGEIGERVRDVGMGCCVLRVERSDDPDGFKERLVLPLWRSISSLNLMLPKEERRAMLLRLYNDDSPLIDNSKDRFNKPNGAQTAIGNVSAIPDSTAAENVTATAAEVQDAPKPIAGDADDVGQPETFIREEGTASLNTAMDPDVKETITAVGAPGIGTEEQVMQAEDALRSMTQNEADNTKEIAPSVTDEEDVFDTTV